MGSAPSSQPSGDRVALFVCAGNTCRSPMAAALARLALQRRGSRVRVESAGAFAMAGNPATPEAVAAMARAGADLRSHRSSPLTRALLGEADVIFALSRSHVEAIIATDPSAADRVYLMDPSGADVADPIGGPQSVYDATAARLAELIEQRMPELEGGGTGSLVKGEDGADSHRG